MANSSWTYINGFGSGNTGEILQIGNLPFRADDLTDTGDDGGSRFEYINGTVGSGSLSSAYWDSDLGIMIPKVKNFAADGTTKSFITLNYWDSTISRESQSVR